MSSSTFLSNDGVLRPVPGLACLRRGPRAHALGYALAPWRAGPASAGLKEVAEKSQSHSWPPMNTDERRLKTIALSAFISVDRRLNLPFPDFFSSL
jgi:hypothetical protein